MDGAVIYSEDEVDTYAQVVAACPVAGSATSRSLSENLVYIYSRNINYILYI